MANADNAPVKNLYTEFMASEARKTLFKSPVVENDRLSDHFPSLCHMNRLQIEYDIEVSHKNLQRDLHEQRLKQLRNYLKSFEEDDWRYPSVEKILGFK
ncbi:hypothetical protein ACJMK2_033701 [Sinanodonta woodiana]|uniref:Uncharacterized protein n=1 Tax=Sinanodonta woodiana TaxID=1069815 RepID=A0ABD3WP74_SINWO